MWKLIDTEFCAGKVVRNQITDTKTQYDKQVKMLAHHDCGQSKILGRKNYVRKEFLIWKNYVRKIMFVLWYLKKNYVKKKNKGWILYSKIKCFFQINYGSIIIFLSYGYPSYLYRYYFDLSIIMPLKLTSTSTYSNPSCVSIKIFEKYAKIPPS